MRLPRRMYDSEWLEIASGDTVEMFNLRNLENGVELSALKCMIVNMSSINNDNIIACNVYMINENGVKAKLTSSLFGMVNIRDVNGVIIKNTRMVLVEKFNMAFKWELNIA